MESDNPPEDVDKDVTEKSTNSVDTENSASNNAQNIEEMETSNLTPVTYTEGDETASPQGENTGESGANDGKCMKCVIISTQIPQ